MENLLLYSPEISPRLKYIAGHLAFEILGIGLNFTSDLNQACTTDIPLINYSSHIVPGAVNILPHGLLEQTGILPQEIDMGKDKGVSSFFHCKGESDTGFDIFAASFYLISRYEEYLPFIKDIHGRFPYSESLAAKSGVEEEPLIELWAIRLKESIIRKYSAFRFPERSHSFISTIDIDIPYAYLNRGFWRSAGGFARSLLKADYGDFISRYGVLFKNRPDPFDTYEFIDQFHSGMGQSPVFFFSVGGYGRFDKCVSPRNPAYRKLISDLSKRYRTGIHPSYKSGDDPVLLFNEINEFSEITGKDPVRSRQHYLRMSLPESYRLLISCGISEDFTMGWAETPGFRAGTCNPFLFYDLEKESVTSLRVFPFQIMDGSLRDYLNLEHQQAAELACRIARKVRDVNGTLITLWHNESFSGSQRWKEWNRVYLEIVKAII